MSSITSRMGKQTWRSERSNLSDTTEEGTCRDKPRSAVYPRDSGPPHLLSTDPKLQFILSITVCVCVCLCLAVRPKVINKAPQYILHLWLNIHWGSLISFEASVKMFLKFHWGTKWQHCPKVNVFSPEILDPPVELSCHNQLLIQVRKNRQGI